MSAARNLNRSSVTGRFIPKTLEERYEQYRQEYREAQIKQKKRGREMLVKEALNFREFEAWNVSMQNSAAEKGKEFKLNLNEIRELVAAETYKISKAQARGIQKIIAAETRDKEHPFGIRVTYEEIRSGEYLIKGYDFEKIWQGRISREYYEHLKNMSGRQAAQKIASAWFGSK